MSPDPTCFTSLNLPPNFAPPESMEYFTLTAAPNTNLWRKPPARDTATAPLMFTALSNPLTVAEVTISADWEMEWDQGGLVIFAGRPPGSLESRFTSLSVRDRSSSSEPATSSKWVKAGVEFADGTLSASAVVASGCSADWSVTPLYPECSPLPPYPLSHSTLRVKIEKEGDSLWVWYQRKSDVQHHPHCGNIDPYSPAGIARTWKKLREVTGFFYDVDYKDIHIGVYASRPATFAPMVGGNGSWNGQYGSDVANGLVVEFENLEIF